jgi:hypothetical protein
MDHDREGSTSSGRGRAQSTAIWRAGNANIGLYLAAMDNKLVAC